MTKETTKALKLFRSALKEAEEEVCPKDAFILKVVIKEIDAIIKGE